MFENVDLDSLWYKGDYFGKEDYECNNIVSVDLIKGIEKDLGFKLPKSYIFLMKKHNGGILSKNCVHNNKIKKYDDIEGIYGLGRSKRCSIYETNKEKEPFEENFIAICSSNSGHAGIYLDYSICGVDGEPRVIAIDYELMINDKIPQPLVLADDFESFIKSLHEDDDNYEDENDIKFVPDDNLHKLVVKKFLKDNSGMYMFVLIIFLITVIGFVFSIRILMFLILFDILLFIMGIVSSIDVLKRNYKCWYDQLADIREENGRKVYILKDTERKMNFIINKHEKINIGDKFLCTTEGYAFKYDESK